MVARFQGRQWLALLPAVFFSLACGSLWRESQARTFSELSIDLQEWIDLDDPNREEVKTLIDEGWMAAWEGRLGWFGGMGFEVAFEECAADGSFDEGEVKELRRLAESFVRRSPEGPHRDKLLARKASMDAEVMVRRKGVVRARRGRLDGAGGDISNWLLPDDVRDAVESAGWEVETCRSDDIDNIQFVFCEARRGPLYAFVKMNRYPREEEARQEAEHLQASAAGHHDGDTTLTVTVLDGPAGEVLRNAIVAKGDRLSKLSAGPVQASITGAGWDLDGCDAHKEGGMVTVSCEAHQHGRQALVDLVQHRGEKAGIEEEERVVVSGEASVHQGRNYLKAVVRDTRPAQELVTGLLE